ncbi:Spy/CpxP family protein refolding chaperone [Arsukibacterium indicum]|uniref:Spy/CpxP family protein refolding chaperone n=1 Tax=Arsukibacterium indicum TaxID=2848612 RepID=A0ABS6MMQ4_9GAMM|nr:Spy/CpxP family protein refolding chaperone [Arsukibacterium indicum]MBV2130089.1 Spy/CpxP family protein refolding chaperone [Arsukibacterium indicum]
MMKAITLMVTFISLFLVTTTASAGYHNKPEQPDKSHKMQRGGFNYQKMLAGLDLTASQQQQLRQLVKDHKANRPERKRGDGTQHALRELVTADYFDDAAATELLQQQEQQRVERRLAQLKLRHQVYQMLTPEQRQQLASEQQQRKLNWQQKRNLKTE